jgi:hypothetical protein
LTGTLGGEQQRWSLKRNYLNAQTIGVELLSTSLERIEKPYNKKPDEVYLVITSKST